MNRTAAGCRWTLEGEESFRVAMSRVIELLSDLRRRLRTRIVLRGAGWTVAALLFGLMFAAGIDVWRPIDGGWLRMSLLAGVLSLTALVAYRVLWRPLAGRWDDVTLALLVERLLPEFRDRLATAVAVASTRGSGDGAPDLPGQTIAWAEAAMDARLARELPRPYLAAASGGALLTAIGLLTAWWLLAPGTLGLALERQWRPFHGPDWPRATVLTLLDEQLQPLTGDVPRWPAEEPLTIYVANRRGPLPRDLRLESRLDDQPTEIVELTSTSLRDERGVERVLAVVTLSPKPGQLWLRATGGDDDSAAWQVFDVRPAPRWEQFDIEIVPPAYTGQASTREQRTTAHVEGLVGSLARIHARANTPLADVRMHRDGWPPQSPPLDGDRRGCLVELSIVDEGRSSFWFDLQDEYGVSSPRPTKYELRGRRDQPPQIVWEQPTADLTVTARAQLPLAVACSDDIGLVDAELRFTVSGHDHSSGAISLAFAEWNEPPVSNRTAEQLRFDWSLADLGLQPGDRVEYRVAVVDGREPESQETLSRAQSLLTVSDEEKRREIAGLQAGISQLVERITDQLARAQQQRGDLETQWRLAGELRAEDREWLDELEQQPRRSLSDLTDARVGLAIQMERVRQELRWNRLSDAPTATRMDRLTALLQPLVQHQLPLLRQHVGELHRAITSRDRTGQRENPPSADDSWDRVAEAQAEAARSLMAMSSELQEWRQRIDASQAIDKLLASQRQVRNDTATLGTQTLSRDFSELSDQQRADLARLASRQRALPATVERLLAEHSETSRGTGVDDSEVELPPEVHDGRLAGWMRQAADEVAANQLGQAGEQQALVIDSLSAAAEQLGRAGGADPLQQLAWLKTLRSEVDELRRRQTELQQQSQDLRSRSADRFAQEQLESLRTKHSALTNELEQLATQLQRRLLTSAANVAGQAANHSRKADSALADSRFDEAQPAQQQVLEALDALDHELAHEQQRAEQRQHVQLLLELAEVLPSLRESQAQVLESTQTLEAERAAAGRWGRGQLKRLQELTTQQQQLASDLLALSERGAAIELLQVQLQSIAEKQSQATERLRARHSDDVTASLQRDAVNGLVLLIASIQPPTGDRSASAATAPDEATEPSVELNFVELRLLRSLQADLLRRTEDWRHQVTGREPTEAEQSRRAALAREQTELGQRAERLWRKLHAAQRESD